MKRFILCATAALLAFFASRFSQVSYAEMTTPDQIQIWIEQLDSNHYEQREQATENLAAAAEQAIDQVAAAAMSDNAEVSWRAASVLEQIGLNGNEETLQRVIEKMQSLSGKGHKALARTSTQLSAKWRETRHARAAKKLAKLGAQIQDVPGGFALDGFGGLGGFVAGEMIIEVEDPVAGEDIKVIEMGEAVKLFKVPLDEVKLPTIEEEFDLLREADGKDVENSERKAAEPVREDPPSEDEPIDVDVVEVDVAPEIEKPGIVPAKIRDLEIAIEEAADEVEEVAVEVEEVLEDFAIDVDIGFAMPPPAMFGGGFWVEGPTSGEVSRVVTLGPSWKGKDQDYQLLAELSRVTTLNLSRLKLSDAAIRHIDQMSNLVQISMTNCQYNRDLMLRYKRRHPNLNLYARGNTILGVSGQPNEKGFHVTHVVSGSGADKAGIRSGDTIVGADGMRMLTLDELTIIVSPKKVGDKLTVSYLRNGRLARTVAILQERREADARPVIDLDEIVPLEDPAADIDE